MSRHALEEVRAAYDRLVATRDRIDAGELGWDSLAAFFTDDATFIDPAWGRIQGIAAIREFLVRSMAGLEGWSFPRVWTSIDGERVVSQWQNRLPGTRSNGTAYEAPGISILTYAGRGLFSREEDLLNMVHVNELIRESGWKPGPGFQVPPRHPPR
ncbi:MAG: nuclear transport factor 2 family protein [Myxococcota bacterium]